MTRRLLLALVFVCALMVSGNAQVMDQQFISATSADCSTASSCAVFNVGAIQSLTLTLSGTFVATVVFEATSDNVNWVTVQTTNVTDGTATTTAASTGVTVSVANVGYLKVRVRASAYTSGNVKVSATRGYASSARLGGSGSGSTYTNLVQVDPNTLAVRNGTTAQDFSVAQSYTDASNYRQLRFSWDSPGQFWNINDRAVVAGSPSAAIGSIRITARNIELREPNNAASFQVTDTGIHTVSSQLYYDTIDTGFRVTGSRGTHAKECWATNQLGTSAQTLCAAQYESGVLGLFNNGGNGETTGGSGTLMIGDAGSKPTCQASRRGMFWHDFGAAGVKDTVEICAKDASDAYAWRTIY